MNRTYSIRSLYAAAAVKASGAEYVGVEQGEEGKTRFIFADPEGRVADLERSYFRRDLPAVQPADYVDNMMKLRDDMYRPGRGSR